MLTLEEVTAACGALDVEGHRRISAYLFRLWVNNDHEYVMFILGHIKPELRAKIEEALEQTKEPSQTSPQLMELATV